MEPQRPEAAEHVIHNGLKMAEYSIDRTWPLDGPNWPAENWLITMAQSWDEYEFEAAQHGRKMVSK